MAYDVALAEELRELLAPHDGVTEQRMFGGLAFLVHGHLAVGASRSGGLLVRVDPGAAGELLALSHVEPMQMGGRTMRGWLHVDPTGPDDLADWVERSLAYVRTLPPK